jgi:hypothetical protein
MSREDQKTILSWVKWSLGIIIGMSGIATTFTFANTAKVAKMEAKVLEQKESIIDLEKKFTYWIDIDDLNNSAIIAQMEGDTEYLQKIFEESKRLKMKLFNQY